jgi:hypothetical protein
VRQYSLFGDNSKSTFERFEGTTHVDGLANHAAPFNPHAELAKGVLPVLDWQVHGEPGLLGNTRWRTLVRVPYP